MKVCPRCKQQKSLSKFNKNKSTKDGLQTYCKPCQRAVLAEWRANNLEHARKLDREQKQRERERKGQDQVNAEYRAWYAKNAQRKRDYETKKRDPVKYRANNILNYNVKIGKVIRPKVCDICGEERKVDGHHHDYSKPLDVTWLCRRCHTVLTYEEKAKESSHDQ